MKLTNKETKVLISLINMFQFDGAEWALEGIWLTKLKNKLNAIRYRIHR
jgi:hypothetical protein